MGCSELSPGILEEPFVVSLRSRLARRVRSFARDLDGIDSRYKFPSA